MERKLATILFADLVGSTELGGSLDPEHTRDLLERFYAAMSAEIALGGGTIEKFIGDAVVADFGAPAAQEDHAERALQVAIWMLERLAELFGDGLGLRIGVNSGEIVVGDSWAGGSFGTGDAVNVAARLEQNAAPGEVLVGERTMELVGSAFEFGEQRTIEARGKPEGVPCRKLIRMVAPRRPRGGRGLQTSFIGRANELHRLETALAGADRPTLVTVVGDPGVGKTSLVREFRGRLSEETRFLLGRCASYGRNVAYGPLADVLRQELELREEAAPETMLGRLAGREILGLALGLDVAGDLEPQAAVLALQAEWVRLVSELAAAGPLVLVVEDLHWAAEPLLELLQLTLADANGPVLVLATSRPDREGLPAGETLVLEPLGDDEVAELVAHALGAPLDDAAREIVVRHAEGNPFFVEEVLTDLLGRGLLTRRDGSFTLSEGQGGLGIPDSVQGVLAARIDLLPEEAKRALQAAAVIGRSFSPAGLTALTASSAEVRTLVDRGFVRPTEPELVFKHALTRDVAYAGLPKAERARLHASYALWLDEQNRGDVQAGTLAYHYAAAVAPEIAELAWRDRDDELAALRSSALRWLRRAAELAIGRYDMDEALALLHRAVELEPDDPRLWHEIGHANALKFDGPAFWEAILKALELADDDTLRGELYTELAFAGAFRAAMWRDQPADELVEGWLEQALALTEPGTRARARALLVQALIVDDIQLVDDAIEIGERLGDLTLVSRGYKGHSAIAFRQLDSEAGVEWYERRVRLLDRITDPDEQADILLYSATPHVAVGNVDRARERAQQSAEFALRLNPHHGVHALWMLAEVEQLAGCWDAFLTLTPRVEEGMAANSATPCDYSVVSLLICAVGNAVLDRDDEARRLEAMADEAAGRGYHDARNPLHARLALLRGNLDAVDEYLRDSSSWLALSSLAIRLDGFAALGRREEVESAARLGLPGTYVEPFALRALGLVRGDPALLDRAIERFDALGLTWYAGETRKLASGVVG